MLNNLQNRIKKAFSFIKGNKISDIDATIVLKEISKALIDSDVNHNIVSNFIEKIKSKSVDKKIFSSSLNSKQIIIKLIYDELVLLMGKKHIEINFSGNPAIILICGLQGSGKTTFSSKLALFLKKKNRYPILTSVDIYRPAAIDQLKTLSNSIKVPFFQQKNSDNQNVIKIINGTINESIKTQRDTIIIDTAGRLSIDKVMMNELKKINNHFSPSETLFIVDSMTGQDAINTAKNFSKYLKFDGIVLTKLDGDNKGGTAITISSIIKKPIKFISNGEKIEDIEMFYPDRMANRILGMGDIVSFVEKIQEQFDEKTTKKIYNKIYKNSFDFYDLLDQIKKIKKLGNISNIMSMIPGININNFTNKFQKEDVSKKIKSIILSMTHYERKHPNVVLNNDKIKHRISKGSGIPFDEMNNFLKQFDRMSKITKQIKIDPKKDINDTMKKLLSKIIDKKNEI